MKLFLDNLNNSCDAFIRFLCWEVKILMFLVSIILWIGANKTIKAQYCNVQTFCNFILITWTENNYTVWSVILYSRYFLKQLFRCVQIPLHFGTYMFYNRIMVDKWCCDEKNIRVTLSMVIHIRYNTYTFRESLTSHNTL